MRWRILTLGTLGGTLGLVAETAAYGLGDPGQWIPDLLVGWTFVAGGLAGWWRRPGSGTGPLLAATGYAWFLGSFHGGVLGPIALFALHRGPLIHCVLSFPGGRPSSRLDRATVAAGYVAATVTPVAVSNPATIALGMLVTGAAVLGCIRVRWGRRGGRGPRPCRRRLSSASCSPASSAALLAGIASDVVLAVDEVALVAVAVWMAAVLVAGRWQRAAVTDLVVELRESSVRHAAGRPSPRVGGFVAADRVLGRRQQVRTWTRQAIGDGPCGGVRARRDKDRPERPPVAVLVHDLAVVQDPGLAESIALAVRLAASHANLRAEVRTQVDEVWASRRRLIRVGRPGADPPGAPAPRRP